MKQLAGKAGKVHPVLLVEDDAAYARLVQLYLEEADLLNCKITHVTSLQQARSCLEGDHYFAAILLDLSLPDSHGFETLERLQLAFPNQNIIVMTGQVDRVLGVQAVKAGAQDFLLKDDLDAPQLAKSLRYSIERSTILNRLEETQRLAQIGYWECSPGDHFFSGSEELYRIIGRPISMHLSCEELMNSNSPFHFFIDLQEVSRTLGKVQRDMWITREDGQRCFVSTLCTANRLSNGEYTYYGIIQDITERKQAQELKRARNLVEQEAKVREQLMANISHEMRTPMNAIVGMSNLLRYTSLDANQMESVAAIQQSSSLLLGIVNDILDMSSLQSEQLRLEQKEFYFPGLLADVMGVMKYNAQEKGLRLRVASSPEVPQYLLGDPLRLNQVLCNLVGNAIKFTKTGSVGLAVKVVDMEEQRTKIQFAVSDTGIGIPAGELERIFAPFTRVAQEGERQEGTGLGLAIAQNLVERQGGNIEVQSEEGKGSVFHFELWFDKAAVVPKWEEQPMPQPAGDDIFTLLIAEDHKMNQLVAQRTIEQHWPNVRILLADNGQEAIGKLREEPVHVVLMDIQMPVLDGLEATRIIRQQMDAPVSQIPIIAMTAHANYGKKERYGPLGFDEVVLKPFEPRQLFAAIEHCLSMQL